MPSSNRARGSDDPAVGVVCESARQAAPPRSAPKASDFRSPRVWGEPD